MRLVEVLLRKRPDLRAQNKQGKTPVDVATGDAKALLEQKLAEANASAAAEPPAAATDDEQAETAAPSPDVPVDGGAVAEPAVAEPVTGSKRSISESVGVAHPKAKQPRVVLSFDDGEGDGGDV